MVLFSLAALQKWNEASEYGGTSKESVDIVENGMETDEVELGVLKWTIYRAEANQPSWFSMQKVTTTTSFAPCNSTTWMWFL